MPRLRSSPALFTLAVILVFVVLGLADRHVDLTGQLGLGFATWLVLLAALRPLPLERRVQTLLVVGVATWMEVVGSILWGVYTYRLHNLPLFVPPGHGLVYLAGISLSETRLVRGKRRWGTWVRRRAAKGENVLHAARIAAVSLNRRMTRENGAEYAVRTRRNPLTIR